MAMATTSSLLSLSLLLTLLTLSNSLSFTIVNHCPFTIYPAIQPNSGLPVIGGGGGGFVLHQNTHRSFPAPDAHWSGRIWGRTYCTEHGGGRVTCATGDCGGRLDCGGLGGAAPATIAQFTVHHGGHADLSSYGVSLVDGYNVPMTITPHEGRGQCPVVGCKADLLPACPHGLQVRGSHGGVIGCKSGCAAFGTDELCCRNHYNSPQTCRASSYSQYFKHACPATFTYAHDSPSLTHDCSAPRELKVIFCHP